MGAATAKATRSARCNASDFGTSSPRITWRLVISRRRSLRRWRGHRRVAWGTSGRTRFEQVRNEGLADPAEGQADDGDSELYAVDDFVKLLVQALDDAGADALRFDQLLDASVAHADRANSAAAKKALAATRSRIRKTRSSTKATMDGILILERVILHFNPGWRA